MASDDRACDAGRRAYFEGLWQEPCLQYGNNLLALTDLGGFLQLCDTHIRELMEAGLIDEPHLSKAEFLQRIEGDSDA